MKRFRTFEVRDETGSFEVLLQVDSTILTPDQVQMINLHFWGKRSTRSKFEGLDAVLKMYACEVKNIAERTKVGSCVWTQPRDEQALICLGQEVCKEEGWPSAGALGIDLLRFEHRVTGFDDMVVVEGIYSTNRHDQAPLDQRVEG